MENPTAKDLGLRRTLKGLPEDVIEAVVGYQPTNWTGDDWETIRTFLVPLFITLGTRTTASLRNQIPPLLSFVGWSFQQGVPLTVSNVFTADRVESWRAVLHKERLANSPRLSKATTSDYVSRLRSMGRRLNPASNWPVTSPRVPGGVRRSLRGPYSDGEVIALEQAIQAMPKGKHRNFAETLVVLGLGCGLQPKEVLTIHAHHIVEEDGRVYVDVPGDAARRIPLVTSYAARLLSIKERVGQGPLVTVSAKKNAFAFAQSTLALGAKSPLLSAQTLRTTWMVDRLRAGLDPRELLLTFAGLKSLNNLPDLIRHLPPSDIVAIDEAVTRTVERQSK